jgi:hypothetical protein
MGVGPRSAGSINDKFQSEPFDARGEPWKWVNELIRREDEVDMALKGDERGEVSRARRGHAESDWPG